MNDTVQTTHHLLVSICGEWSEARDLVELFEACTITTVDADGAAIIDIARAVRSFKTILADYEIFDAQGNLTDEFEAAIAGPPSYGVVSYGGPIETIRDGVRYLDYFLRTTGDYHDEFMTLSRFYRKLEIHVASTVETPNGRAYTGQNYIRGSAKLTGFRLV